MLIAAAHDRVDVTRRNRADALIDQLQARPPSRSGDETAVAEALAVDPGCLAGYAVLARRARQLDGLQGVELGAYLQAFWRRAGRGDPRAERFIAAYSDGDPFVWPRARLAGLPPHALVLWMADDLATLDLLELDASRTAARPGDELRFLGRVHAPRVLCSMRDLSALPGSKQTIVEHWLKRGKDHRVVVHGDTVIATAAAVAGPAIDSLYLNAVLRHLVRHPALAGTIRTACEIATGSGFLLCSMLAGLHDAGALYASDVDPVALGLARANSQRIAAQLPRAAAVHLSSSPALLAELPDASVDLLVANPPFLPEHAPSPGDPRAGSSVLADYVAGHGPRVLSKHGAIVVLHSSVTRSIVDRLLRTTPLIRVDVARPRRVPLDLREVLAEPAWLALLRDHGLDEDDGDPDFTYWHTIHALCLVHPGARLEGMNHESR